MKPFPAAWWLRGLAIVVVTLLALFLRMRAVELLPIDYDEDDYLAAAQRYAAALRVNDWEQISAYEFNYEHPPLSKFLYGVAIVNLPPGLKIPERPATDPPARVLPRPHFDFARRLAATFGTLEVFALAWLNPLAALFLGVHTWQIKYTSQIMLEPLPALTSLVMVLFYIRWRRTVESEIATQRASLWLALSAVALGLTAASKYLYCVAAIAIVIDWLGATWPVPPRTAASLSRWLAPLVGWGAIALIIFVIFDPHLWQAGPQRLWQSVTFHGDYAQSEHVARAGFPVWQPLVWLAETVPWHPDVFLIWIDLPISVLAVLGVRRLWRDRHQRVLVIWLALALAFLLWWTTKWPQYILILTAPLTVAAAEGVKGSLGEPLLAWWRRLRTGGRQPPPEHQPDGWRALPWLLPGLLTLGTLTLFPLLFQLAMSLTDFNAISIRDGINGGIWREVWLGITGQVQPVELTLREEFWKLPRTRDVHFAGPQVLLDLFSGAMTNVLVFNVIWAILSVALQTGLGVGVALLLHRRGVNFRSAWRVIFILPWAIPEYIGALIWLRLFEPNYGWLNLFAAGNQARLNPLQDSTSSLVILLLAATWYGFPFIMLAATGALKLIPVEVYEAAALDGAGRGAQFWHITWPMLWPLLAPAVLIRAIFAFNQFYLFFVLEPPNITFATLAYYIFNPTGFFGGWFSISAAINIFTVVVIGVLVVWLGRVSKAAEGVTYV